MPQMSEEELRKVREVFRRFAVDGDVSPDHLEAALRLLDYPVPSRDIMEEVDTRRHSGRSFLDWAEFAHFCTKYREVFLRRLDIKFKSVDLDRSGTIRARSLSTLFEDEGVRPFPTALAEMVVQELGKASGDLSSIRFTFPEYVTIYKLMQRRGGVLDKDLGPLKSAFSKFDSTGQGQLAVSRFKDALALLGFEVRPRSLRNIFRCDPATSTVTLGELAYLTAIRQYRDMELDLLRDAVVQQGGAAGKEVGAALLSEAFNSLNYGIASPEAIAEAMQMLPAHGQEGETSPGQEEAASPPQTSPPAAHCMLVYEELYAVFERLRHTYGFLEAELELIAATHQAYLAALSKLRQLNSTRPSSPSRPMLTRRAALVSVVAVEDLEEEHFLIELLEATQSLGFQAKVSRLQSHLDDLDLDPRGCLQHGDFLRLIAALRCEELRRLRRACTQGTLSRAAFNSAVGALGYVTAQPRNSLLSAAAAAAAKQPVGDFWTAEGCLKQLRAQAAQLFRTNLGFSGQARNQLSEAFFATEPEQSGTCKPKQVVKLLVELFPRSTTDQAEHAKAKALYEEAVSTNGGAMGFNEYLMLQRLARNDKERARLRKELALVRSTSFARKEVSEFRTIYCEAAQRLNAMTLQEFSDFVSRVVPVRGRGMERELRDTFLELGTADAGEEGKVFGFGEFLVAIEQLVHQNWYGINEAAASLSARGSAAPPKSSAGVGVAA